MAHLVGHVAAPSAGSAGLVAITGRPLRNPHAVHGFGLRTCSIAGLGAYLPVKTLTNATLAQSLGVSSEVIFNHTGIRERRIADATGSTSVMATRAAVQALADAGIGAEAVDLIVMATSSPDMAFPPTVCLVQAQIGARLADDGRRQPLCYFARLGGQSTALPAHGLARRPHDMPWT